MDAVDVARNLKKVLTDLPEGVRLVAVSKYHPEEDIEKAYAEGQRLFGESHERELSRKATALPKDIEWHFIGHLQTNKVKYIAPYIGMIESVDSVKLLKEIDKQALKYGRIIKVLLELHVASEDTKYGFSIENCRKMLEEGEWRGLKNVRICGLMTMATFTDDERQIRKEFTLANEFFKEIKEKYFPEDDFCERSWGMSNDYPVACECGSTLVRVGTSIFGDRSY